MAFHDDDCDDDDDGVIDAARYWPLLLMDGESCRFGCWQLVVWWIWRVVVVDELGWGLDRRGLYRYVSKRTLETVGSRRLMAILQKPAIRLNINECRLICDVEGGDGWVQSKKCLIWCWWKYANT